jgi:hypothetical protein
MGPAIAYSNLLGLKLCFPQVNVSPAIFVSFRGDANFQLAQFPIRWQFGQWDPSNKRCKFAIGTQLGAKLLGPQPQLQKNYGDVPVIPIRARGAIAVFAIAKSA